MVAKVKKNSECEICILAGGLSSRMGCDKAKVRLGRRTLLGHVRHAAKETGLPVRVVRADIVPRSGPLGGVYTALMKCRAESVLFLSCDMPLLTPRLMDAILRSGRLERCAVFTRVNERSGFPFLIWRDSFASISRAIGEDDLALQSLARRLKAKHYDPPTVHRWRLANINTPDELEGIRRVLFARGVGESCVAAEIETAIYQRKDFCSATSVSPSHKVARHARSSPNIV